MAAARHSKSADVRAKLGHPVIDSDGHVVECTPVLHVPHVHEVFTPTREEIEYWKALVDLAERTEGSGPVRYGSPTRGEGHVVHLAHVGSARLNLEWARGLRLEL